MDYDIISEAIHICKTITNLNNLSKTALSRAGLGGWTYDVSTGYFILGQQIHAIWQALTDESKDVTNVECGFLGDFGDPGIEEWAQTTKLDRVEIIRSVIRYILERDESIRRTRKKNEIVEEENINKVKVDRQKISDAMLGRDQWGVENAFSGINKGLKCWYLARVWKIMGMCNYSSPAFDELVKENGKDVEDFVSWLKGASYSRQSFVDNGGPALMPVLMGVVHSYLSPPDDFNIMNKVLSMI